MKIYTVVGESGTYAERLQWNVDAWVDEHLAKERVDQLKGLLTQLGWPAFHPRANEATYRVTTTQFNKIIDRLVIAKNGDPNAAWNGGDLYINYTVEDLELHINCTIKDLELHGSKEEGVLQASRKEICAAFGVPYFVTGSDGGIIVPEEIQPALIEAIKEHKTIMDIRKMIADDAGTIL